MTTQKIVSNKLPPRPERPECYARWGKRGEKPGDHETVCKYREDSKEWDKLAAPVGRSYNPDLICDQAYYSHELLLEWLNMIGAPDEIKALAKYGTDARVKYSLYVQRWTTMPESEAADVAQFVPILQEAIDTVRFTIEAYKNR